MKGKKSKSLLQKILIIICVVLLAIAAVFGFYVHDYYHADTEALAVLKQPDPQVAVDIVKGKQIVFRPAVATVSGLIFYPVGKVQYEAYAPLMQALARHGIFCVIARMPCNLAVLDVNAAAGIAELYPEVKHWYIGGHSLGGVMAASFAAGHSDEIDGLILLAAYTTKSLAEGSLRCLSVYGSEDGVLNMESYQKNYKNLPSGTKEYVIEGGCHAYFGNYGIQDGDGTPSITRDEQIAQTADVVAAFLKGEG